MERTQIYLTTEEATALDLLARERGTTRSHLIREAIDAHYIMARVSQRDRILAALEAARAARPRPPSDDPGETGEEYVERTRSGDRWRELYGDDWGTY